MDDLVRSNSGSSGFRVGRSRGSAACSQRNDAGSPWSFGVTRRRRSRVTDRDCHPDRRASDDPLDPRLRGDDIGERGDDIGERGDDIGERGDVTLGRAVRNARDPTGIRMSRVWLQAAGPLARAVRNPRRGRVSNSGGSPESRVALRIQRFHERTTTATGTIANSIAPGRLFSRSRSNSTSPSGREVEVEVTASRSKGPVTWRPFEVVSRRRRRRPPCSAQHRTPTRFPEALEFDPLGFEPGSGDSRIAKGEAELGWAVPLPLLPLLHHLVEDRPQ